MAVEAAREAGLAHSCPIKGGLDAWTKLGGPVEGGGAQG
jgi:rhodanese-related sulfurtransferase